MGLWFKQIQKTQVSSTESRQCERLEETFIVKYVWTFSSQTIEANSYGGYLWAHILRMLLRDVWPSGWKRCQDIHQLVVVSAVLFNELGLHFSTTRVLWSPINNLRKKIIFTGCFHHHLLSWPFIHLRKICKNAHDVVQSHCVLFIHIPSFVGCVYSEYTDFQKGII